MPKISLAEFADSVSEFMPMIAKEFLKSQAADFYKTRITMPQFYVLDILHRRGESNMTDLAKDISVTPAAITGRVDRVVKGASVRRLHDPADRRIVKIRLTAKGENTVRRIVAKRKETMMSLFGVISEKEREEYLNILRHINDHIQTNRRD